MFRSKGLGLLLLGLVLFSGFAREWVVFCHSGKDHQAIETTFHQHHSDHQNCPHSQPNGKKEEHEDCQDENLFDLIASSSELKTFQLTSTSNPLQSNPTYYEKNNVFVSYRPPAEPPPQQALDCLAKIRLLI